MPTEIRTRRKSIDVGSSRCDSLIVTIPLAENEISFDLRTHKNGMQLYPAMESNHLRAIIFAINYVIARIKRSCYVYGGECGTHLRRYVFACG